MTNHLLTAALRSAFASTGRQENGPDPIVVAKFFVGSATWYATEFDGDDEFFGYVCLGDHEMAEWGYFSLLELETLKGPRPLRLPVERDLYWRPKPMSQALTELCGGGHR